MRHRDEQRLLKMYIFNVIVFIIYVLVCCLHMSVAHMCACCLQKLVENVRSPGSGVTDDCESLYGFWELNSGPLKEQPVLLIAKLSFQLHS